VAKTGLIAFKNLQSATSLFETTRLGTMQGVANKNYARSILSVIVSRASSQVLSTVIGFKPSRTSFQSTKVHYHSGRSYSTRYLKDYGTESFLYYRFSQIS